MGVESHVESHDATCICREERRGVSRKVPFVVGFENCFSLLRLLLLERFGCRYRSCSFCACERAGGDPPDDER